MIIPQNIDYEKFKGFALHNSTEHDIGIIIRSEVIPTLEFLLRPNQTYYARVADLINIISNEDVSKFGITQHLDEFPEYCGTKTLFSDKERKNWWFQ
jgi:hypothetical protein